MRAYPSVFLHFALELFSERLRVRILERLHMMDPLMRHVAIGTRDIYSVLCRKPC
jgi:hypothetical protein